MTKNRFRTQFDPGDYEDFTICKSPDLVDPTGYESLSSIISRMLRGEIVRPTSPSYDFGSEKEEDFDAFESIEDISEAYAVGAEMASKLREKAFKDKSGTNEPKKEKEPSKEENGEKVDGDDAEAASSGTGAAAPRPEV